LILLTDACAAHSNAPAGRVRNHVLEDAIGLLLEPVMPIFVGRDRGVEIDITASNRMIDVVGEGSVATIRYGRTVPEDMIAKRLFPDMRWIAAASPAYLERFGVPTHSQDLRNHRCVGIRLGNDHLYQWSSCAMAITPPTRECRRCRRLNTAS
jgi:DNA-binding transcriptional LysR family regulator